MGGIKAYAKSILLACLILCAVGSLQGHRERVVSSRERATIRLINEAEKHVGIRESGGNNRGPWIKKYLAITGLKEGNPWCAAFQAYIHDHAEIPAPTSARVVDWFVSNVVWRSEWGDLQFTAEAGMVGGLYYQRQGRLGHIFLVVGQDQNNYYTIEGNTNGGGSNDGDGVYRMTRPKKSVAALADYCLSGKDFIDQYDVYLQKYLKNNGYNKQN